MTNNYYFYGDLQGCNFTNELSCASNQTKPSASNQTKRLWEGPFNDTYLLGGIGPRECVELVKLSNERGHPIGKIQYQFRGKNGLDRAKKEVERISRACGEGYCRGITQTSPNVFVLRQGERKLGNGRREFGEHGLKVSRNSEISWVYMM